MKEQLLISHLKKAFRSCK